MQMRSQNASSMMSLKKTEAGSKADQVTFASYLNYREPWQPALHKCPTLSTTWHKFSEAADYHLFNYIKSSRSQLVEAKSITAIPVLDFSNLNTSEWVSGLRLAMQGDFGGLQVS